MTQHPMFRVVRAARELLRELERLDPELLDGADMELDDVAEAVTGLLDRLGDLVGA
jgi:hypothetical protein